MLIVLMHIMGILKHQCQGLQNKQLTVLFSCYKKMECVFLFYQIYV